MTAEDNDGEDKAILKRDKINSALDEDDREISKKEMSYLKASKDSNY